MDDSMFAKDWEQTRQRGVWRYIVDRAWNWCVFVAVFILIGVWLDGDPFELLHFVLMLAVGFAGCCVWAPLGWYLREARYKEFLERASGR